MHRVATEAGGLDLERRLQSIKQSPAELVFVSSADTELAALARIWGPRFGSRLRLMNASLLQHPEAAEHMPIMYCFMQNWLFFGFMEARLIFRNCWTNCSTSNPMEPS